MKKRLFELVFILISTAIILLLNQFELLEKHVGFILIPILIAFYLGQYIERKFKRES